MSHAKSGYTKRCSMDRRSPVDRRIIDLGPGCPGSKNRKKFKERRRGWEDRSGWGRISKWSSSPIYFDLP